MPTLTELLIATVLAVWIIASIVGTVTGDYREFELVTPIMSTLVAAIVAAGIVRRGGGKDGDAQ